MSEEHAQPDQALQPLMRFEVRQFGDTQGRRITQFVPLDGSPVHYRGQQTRIVQNSQTGQKRPLPFEFGIQAETIAQAFDVFDETADRAWPEAMGQLNAHEAEARRPKIVRATGGAKLPPGMRHDGSGLQMP